jgi:hypothetical protein
MMNFKQVVVEAYRSTKGIKSPDKQAFLEAYFVSNARMAERDIFIEATLFLKGCRQVVDLYQTEIKRQYEEQLHKGDIVLRNVEAGRGIPFPEGVVTDKNNPRVQDSIQRIINHQEYVKGRGAKSFAYTCNLTKDGDILTEQLEAFYFLEPRDVDELHEAIMRAEQKIVRTSPSEQKVKKRKSAALVPFSSYLHHHDKTALLSKLHELIDGKHAKTIAMIIKALEELSFLAGYDSKNNLYKSIREEFEVTFSNSGINKFLNTNTEKLNINDIRPIIGVLQKV